MGLETVVNIADFVKTNPTGADPKSQGDDHIRNLKTALLNDFAGFTGAVMVTGVDGGAVNAYTLTPANALPAYGSKMVAVFAPTIANTGACTLNISGLGVRNILSVSGAPLVAGDLTVGGIYSAFYDGAQFRLTSITKNYADQLAFSAALPAKALGLLASPDGVTVAFTKNLAFGLNEAKAADVASSATPDIWSGNGNTMHITGVVGLTGFPAAPQAGAWRQLYFDGACLLTNSANFNVQGGANYTTSAGDIVFVYADTANKFYLFIQKANGAPVAATPYLHVREEQASGTNAGASIVGTQVRVLNTIVGTNTIPGASLASNMVTLPAGTYDFEASAPASKTDSTRLTLYNNTNAADLMVGPSQSADIAVNAGTNTQILCHGRFTLTASKAVNLNHYTSTAVATNGLGSAISTGQPEVYSSIKLWKVA